MSGRSRLVLVAAAAGVVAAGLYAYRDSEESNEVSVPALEAEDGLRLDCSRRLVAGRQRFELRLGAGAAVLSLGKVDTKEPFTFGSGTLEAVSSNAGAVFVDSVAAWVGASSPPTIAGGEIRPFPINFVVLGANRGWTAYKLFLEQGQQYAEVFFNVREDGSEARLVEKDSEYRHDLITLLARALRDGQAPRRTSANDPLLESDVPLATDPKELPGANGVRIGAWGPYGLLGWTKIGKKAGIRLWLDPAEPPRDLGTAPGWPTSVEPHPSKPLFAVVLVQPQEDSGGYSSDDPGQLVTINTETSSVVPLMKHSPAPTIVVWSPDGSRLAIGLQVGRKNSTLILSTTGKELASAGTELDVVPASWDPDGLVLRHVDWDPSNDPSYRFYRWNPPTRPMEIKDLPLVSPDGSAALSASEGGLKIRGSTPHDLPLARKDDRDAAEAILENGPDWLGSKAFLWHAEDLLVLNVASGKLRFLFPVGIYRFLSASTDGRYVLARRGDGEAVWSTTQW
ncbi:MAG: hypothetical protein IT384_33900 [Deltaproteobacteria bacterium]|nr:hypothetical protein [Deltaproteobacteria bacterium]